MQNDDQFSVEAEYRSRRKHGLSRRRDALYITPRRIYERERGKHSMPNLDSGKGDLLHRGATLLRAGNFR